MRLHSKVLLVVVPLAVIPLLILGWLAYDQLRSTAIERSSSQMTTLMDQMTRSFQMHQDVAKANVKLFSDASLVRAYALTKDEEERYVLMLPSLLKLFTSYLRAYPDYAISVSCYPMAMRTLADLYCQSPISVRMRPRHLSSKRSGGSKVKR